MGSDRLWLRKFWGADESVLELVIVVVQPVNILKAMLC